jgi:hypothetical protein
VLQNLGGSALELNDAITFAPTHALNADYPDEPATVLPDELQLNQTDPIGLINGGRG